jgi:REP element-mobilizing transposase RayT
VSTKHAMHLVLKSKKAIGKQSFYHLKEEIQQIITKYARKYGIEIKDLVNMGNHFHVKLRVTKRDLFGKFLKTVTALIARLVTKAKRGKKFGKFWDALAFTRILKTKFEELQLRGYFKANRIEQRYGYQARADYLAQFNEWLYRLKKLKKQKV